MYDLKLSSKTFEKHVRNAQTQNLEQKEIWKPKAPFLKNIINCLAPTKEKTANTENPMIVNKQ